MFKSVALNLSHRTIGLTPSEVVEYSKSPNLITSFDDFAEYAKGYLDDDALQYAKEVLGNDVDDTARLKKIAQLVEDGSEKIGKKLSKEELKAGLDALWDDAGVEGALAAIERVFKGDEYTIIWDKIVATAENMKNTEIPATFQMKLNVKINYVNPETGTNVLWANANATKHMGEYVGRFGEISQSIGVRSQLMLESFRAALNEAMETMISNPPGRQRGKYGNWEFGINTKQVLYIMLECYIREEIYEF